MKPRPRNEPSEWPRKTIGVARLLGGDQTVQGPEVADDLVPSALVGEMAEIGGGGLGPVAAMIVGVNGVARGVERRGETRVTGAVLGEAMGDLHDPRAERPSGSQRRARRLWPSSARSVNSLSGIPPRYLRRPQARERLGISRVCASRVKPVGDREILLAESVGIG